LNIPLQASIFNSTKAGKIEGIRHKNLTFSSRLRILTSHFGVYLAASWNKLFIENEKVDKLHKLETPTRSDQIIAIFLPAKLTLKINPD
jgi:hypothetical protein